MQRSRIYSTYSDEQLIELYRNGKLSGENKHFLNVELIFRNLLENADQQKQLTIKSQPKNWKKFFLFLLFGAAILILRFL